MTPEQLWQATLSELQLQIARSTFDTWLRDTQFIAAKENEIVIGVQTEYAKDWLENRLGSTLRRVLAAIARQPIELTFMVLQASDSADTPDIDPEPEAPARLPNWSEIGVPCTFQGESLESFDWTGPAIQGLSPSERDKLRDYLDRALDYLAEGIGLTLIGTYGTGKSHLVVGVLKLACTASLRHVRFVDFSELTDQLRLAYAEGQREWAVLQPLREAEVLVLDDVRHTGPAWCMEKLQWVIARRYNDHKPTLLTSNLSLDELQTAGLDGSAIDRLAYSSIVVVLNGPSYRAQRRREVVRRVQAQAEPSPAARRS